MGGGSLSSQGLLEAIRGDERWEGERGGRCLNSTWGETPFLRSAFLQSLVKVTKCTYAGCEQWFVVRMKRQLEFLTGFDAIQYSRELGHMRPRSWEGTRARELADVWDRVFDVLWP